MAQQYSTHPFRPTVGNAAFCADCPAGSSFGATHPWHQGHQAVPLATAKLALERMPSEALWAELARRHCVPLASYTAGVPPTCSTHRRPLAPEGLCIDGQRTTRRLVGAPGSMAWDKGVGYAEASDMGLGVGDFPDTVLVPGPAGQPVAMRKHHTEYRNDELVSVEYGALLGGLRLVLVND